MSNRSTCRCGRAGPRAPRSSRPSRRSWRSPRSATAARPAPDGITGQIAYFDSVDALRAAPDSAVRGKIVFIDHHMMPAQDGSGYGQFGAPRRQGPTIASLKGAIGIVVRSIGTDHHRNPAHRRPIFHRWRAGRSRPARSPFPDAEQLVRILKRGKPVVDASDPGQPEAARAAIRAMSSPKCRAAIPSAPILLVGGHLDSWDLGTGAIDDGVGRRDHDRGGEAHHGCRAAAAARSASSGSAPRSRAGSAARLMPRRTASSATPSPAKATSARTASGASLRSCRTPIPPPTRC